MPNTLLSYKEGGGSCVKLSKRGSVYVLLGPPPFVKLPNAVPFPLVLCYRARWSPTPRTLGVATGFQRLAEGLVRGLRYVSLEHKRLRADFIMAFKIFKDEIDLNPPELG